MERVTFKSPAIAKAMEKAYGNAAKTVRIQMRHERDVRNYVKRIEDGHKKAASSHLHFD